MADIETFKPLRNFGEVQLLLDAFQLRHHGSVSSQSLAERMLGIDPGHLQPARALTTDPMADRNFSAGSFAQRFLEQSRVIDPAGNQHLIRRLSRQVILGEERRHHFLDDRALGGFREIRLAAQAAPGTNEHDTDTKSVFCADQADRVKIPGPPVDKLPFLDFLQAGYLIPVMRCFFIVPGFRGNIHALDQPIDDQVALAFEKKQRIGNIAAVLFLPDQSDTGRRTPLDLVLQTGPAAIRKITVIA